MIDNSLTGKRILLVSINFAPEPTGIGPYATDLAEALQSAGAAVRVLTGIASYPGWRVPRYYRWRLEVREEHGGIGVLRLRHYVPGSQSFLKRALYELTFALQVARRARMSDVDVVVSTTPALLSALVATRAARRSTVPALVWVQDLMTAAISESGIGGGRVARACIKRLELALFNAATGLVVVSPRFQDLAPSHLRPAIKYVPNWSVIRMPSLERGETRKKMGWGKGTVVIHSGNMGLKQGLENVLHTAALASDVHFVLLGDGSERRRLEALATGLELANVEFLDPVPREEYPEILAAADVLLLNERPTLRDMSLPSKLTSYLQIGLPIVAAVNSESATADALADVARAVTTVAGNPTALVEAIKRAMSLGPIEAAKGAEQVGSSASGLIELIRAAVSNDGRRGSVATPAERYEGDL